MISLKIYKPLNNRSLCHIYNCLKVFIKIILKSIMRFKMKKEKITLATVKYLK